MNATMTAPAPVRPKADDQLVHLFCDCTPDDSLCGLDISDATYNDNPADPVCVVCDDFVDEHCKECGE